MNGTIERSQAHATFVLKRTCCPEGREEGSGGLLDQFGSYLVRGR